MVLLLTNIANGAETMQTYTGKIKISQYGQMTTVTIQARTIQDARRLLEMQYGRQNVMNVW